MTSFDHLIVGGGLAGATTVQTLLEHGVDGRRIALIGAEPELPYHRPPLSKGYLLGRERRDALFVKSAAFYETAGVTLFLGTRATAVKPWAHTVSTDCRGDFRYGKLLLAHGCRLGKLSVPGSDLPRLHYLRTLADADALNAAVTAARSAVVVGGSFIGMELAAALIQRGLSTTLLHRGSAVFDKLGSTEASAFFARLLTERGVTIRTEDEATGFSKAADGHSLEVATKRGDAIIADLVAIGVGVAPITDFLAGSGLTVDNGIVVNECLETSIPDVYAAGDVANFFDPLYGHHRRIEHWDTAIQHGKVAGANLAGQRTPYRAVSYFFSDVFDLSFDYFGDPTDTNRAIQRGSFDERAVTLFYLWGTVVRAAFTMGRPHERRALVELIRRATPLPNPDVLTDPQMPLP